MYKFLEKIVNIFFIIGLFITLLPINISAIEYQKGIVKSTQGNGINLRSGAGTSYSRVGGLDDGRVVTIVEEVNTTDGTTSSCSKWYKILYSSGYAYACASFINLIEVEENADYDFETELAKFPDSYKSYITKLHEIYPNAMFFAYNATMPNNGGVMDFKTAVTNENVLGKNLLWDSNNSRDGLKSLDSYIFETNSFNNNYSGGGPNWYAASYDTIAYYMDPRNFLNEKRVFMFESQSYDPTLQNEQGVEAILSGSFMANATVDDTNITFAQAIMDAAKYSNVSPYFLASRILQEVGTTRSDLVKGTYSSYPEFNGYYNYYNINASGSNVVYSGLQAAYNNGWDSEYKAIVYGSSWIGSNYINAGQDTNYSQKWDIQCSSKSSCFNHQYMQNLEAPYTEALKTYNAYNKGANMYLNPYVFNIPVYNNLTTTSLPSTQSPINYLSSITLNNTVISNFDSRTYEYNITVNTSSINIEASSSSSKAKVSGTGSIKLTGTKDVVITVTAENGSTRKYTLHLTLNENNNGNTIKLSDELKKITTVKLDESTISGITSVDVLKEKINSSNTGINVSVKNKNGEVINSGNIATGYKVTLSLNNESKEYEAIIYGDNNGDGEITILDLLRVQKQLLKSINLSGVQNKASDVNKDGSITILDLLLIQKHLLGSKYISQ